MEGKYYLVNEELGYVCSTPYDTFEEAKQATSGKCRSHGVALFDKNDKVVKIWKSWELLD